jgi:hypothetical protein
LWLDFCNMGRGVMFGERVSHVGFSWSVVDKELALTDAVLEPVPTHVHCLGSLLLHGPVGKAVGCRAVDLEGRRGLGMTQFQERGTDGDRVLGIEVARSDLGLGSRPNDDIYDGAERVNGATEGRNVRWRFGGIDGR